MAVNRSISPWLSFAAASSAVAGLVSSLVPPLSLVATSLTAAQERSIAVDYLGNARSGRLVIALVAMPSRALPARSAQAGASGLPAVLHQRRRLACHGLRPAHHQRCPPRRDLESDDRQGLPAPPLRQAPVARPPRAGRRARSARVRPAVGRAPPRTSRAPRRARKAPPRGRRPGEALSLGNGARPGAGFRSDPRATSRAGWRRNRTDSRNPRTQQASARGRRSPVRDRERRPGSARSRPKRSSNYATCGFSSTSATPWPDPTQTPRTP